MEGCTVMVRLPGRKRVDLVTFYFSERPSFPDCRGIASGRFAPAEASLYPKSHIPIRGLHGTWEYNPMYG